MPAATLESIMATVGDIVAAALGVGRERVTSDTSLIYDLGAESIDLVDIRFRLEETFGFRVDQRSFIAEIAAGATPHDVQSLLTVRRLAEFILRRVDKVASA